MNCYKDKYLECKYSLECETDIPNKPIIACRKPDTEKWCPHEYLQAGEKIKPCRSRYFHDCDHAVTRVNNNHKIIRQCTISDNKECPFYEQDVEDADSNEGILRD